MRAQVLCLALVTSACGEPLVGATFEGTPDITLGGVVLQGNARIPASHGALELSVFWIGGADGAQVEQTGRLDSGLAEYTMTLFDAPPPAAAGFVDLASDGMLALGVIALYADRDSSGTLDLSADLLLGASSQHVVVFNDRAISPSDPAAALLGTLEPGYHVFVHDTPSTCPFVMAATCAAEGALVIAEEASAVSLTLWPTAEEVLVPAPALTRGAQPGTIWSARPQ